jgi:endoglucanase
MEPASREFLFELLRTPSPTGREQPVQRLIHDRFKGVAHAIEPDVHGNLILSLNPRARRKVMIAGVGFVNSIDDKTDFRPFHFHD